MGLVTIKDSFAHTTTVATNSLVTSMRGLIKKIQLIASTTCTVAIYASTTSTDNLVVPEYILGGATARVTVTTTGVSYYPAIAKTLTAQSIPAAVTNSYTDYTVSGKLYMIHIGNLPYNGTYSNTLQLLITYESA